jgi:C4-dicarboxylate-specific signal transduction histidine kinase
MFAGTLHGHVTDEQGRESLRHLEQGLDVLKSLLDGLIDVSRLDAGVVQPTIEDVEVSGLLEHLEASYAPVARAKGLEWRMTACPHRIRSDHVLLGRMLRNLVENAIRYTTEGSVEIECKVDGGLLRIDVKDTGVGIPEDQLRLVFEEFHQIGNQERDRSQGLGLGLAIVQRISHLLDHPVTARSEAGKGSTFSIEVPLCAPLDAAPRVPDAARPIEISAPQGSERLAVVIDDDAIVLLGLQAMLNEWGYEVLGAMSAQQAIEKLRTVNQQPDVILADYRLRDGKVGTDAILAVRDIAGAAIPAIVITGETGAECQRDVAQHGFALMHKPVTPRQLSGAIERFLSAAQ